MEASIDFRRSYANRRVDGPPINRPVTFPPATTLGTEHPPPCPAASRQLSSWGKPQIQQLQQGHAVPGAKKKKPPGVVPPHHHVLPHTSPHCCPPNSLRAHSLCPTGCPVLPALQMGCSVPQYHAAACFQQQPPTLHWLCSNAAAWQTQAACSLNPA